MSQGKINHLVIAAKAKQTASVIFLHGLGDSGHGWSSVAQMLRTPLPYIKWILPHAPIKPGYPLIGAGMPRWYDIYSLEDSDAKEDKEGMMDSLNTVMSLVKEEINNGIPSERIIVGGFSQGGALSLLTLVHSDVKLGGVMALSSYLPLRAQFDQLKRDQNKNTPLFMAHGTADTVVLYDWGLLSQRFLKEAGYNVTFKSYPGLPHSVNEDELSDIADFLKRVTD